MVSLAERARAFAADARKNPWFGRGVLVSALVIAADQASKNWILYGLKLPGDLCTPDNPRFCGGIDLSPVFDLTMLWNKGISFGLLSGGMVSRIGLTLFSLGIAGALFYWLASLKRTLPAIGAAMIAGGAIGNAFDRAVYGAVVDFIDVRGLHFPWIFNVADAAINIGVACLLFDALFARDNVKQAPKA